MKKCANCGKENIDKAIFCANCGSKLDSSGTVSNVRINSNSNSTAKESLVGSNKNKSSRSTAGSNNKSSESTVTSSNKSADNLNGQTKGGILNFKVCCCYVPVVLFIILLAFGLIYYGFAESFATEYETDFNYLDLDGDGRLSFFEASQADMEMDNSTMTRYFNDADTNNNGFLKGHEFDLFADDIINYRSRSESSSSDSDKYKYSTSSSSSSGSGSSSKSRSSSSSYSSINDEDYDSSSEGYVFTCPYCGSEAIYESGSYYKCAECGRTIYSPDDLELAYQEGYMELLVPVSIRS